MPAAVYYTADMVRALPEDGNRYETVHGELLVTPAPRAWHQLVLGRLHVTLYRFLETHPIGLLLQSPADISWSDDTLVQPDLFVVDIDEARTMEWARMQHLLLVIEILSPSTTRYDRFTKRRLYQEVRIPDYWIVDIEAKTVEVWHPDDTMPHVEGERVSWRPAGVERALEVSLETLFAPI